MAADLAPRDKRGRYRGMRRLAGGSGAPLPAIAADAGCALVLLLLAATTAAATAAPPPQQQQQQAATNADVLASLLALADGLYNRQNLTAVDAYCDDDVVVHGDGMWLPRVDFTGARWLRSIHREWFAAYSDWSCEVAAAALGTPTSVAAFGRGEEERGGDEAADSAAAFHHYSMRRWLSPWRRRRGQRQHQQQQAAAASDANDNTNNANNAPKYVSAFAFFRWQATNTGPYRGVGPTLRRSEAWGVIEAVLWAPSSKQAATGKAVVALTLRDSGFLEVREASLRRPQPALPLSGPLADELRRSPDWVPSASLRQGAAARLASVLASLAVGGGGGGGAGGGTARMAAVAGAMADASAADVVLADGTDVWGPRSPPERGRGAVAAWLALWAEQRGVERAEVAASAATATSDKVFVSFRLAVPPDDGDDDGNGDGNRVSWPPSRASYIEGVAVSVYDEEGRISRIVLFRNGSPGETRAEMIGGGGGRSAVA